jgi:hypothetical protein
MIGAESSSNGLAIDRFPFEARNSWDHKETFHVVTRDTSSGDILDEVLLGDSLHAEPGTAMPVDELSVF